MCQRQPALWPIGHLTTSARRIQQCATGTGREMQSRWKLEHSLTYPIHRDLVIFLLACNLYPFLLAVTVARAPRWADYSFMSVSRAFGESISQLAQSTFASQANRWKEPIKDTMHRSVPMQYKKKRWYHDGMGFVSEQERWVPLYAMLCYHDASSQAPERSVADE